MSGGGGGSGDRRRGGPRFQERVATSTARATFDAEANAYLQDLLADYNNRDPEVTRERIEEICAAVEADLQGSVETLFGGSVRRHTYVDGLSDVDVLMPVNASELADASPAAVLRFCEERIRAHLGSRAAEVKAGRLAVTVRYRDGTEIQILPALRTATGIRIAGTDGAWSPVVRPQAFAAKLTAMNQANQRLVVPTVKLFKGLQATQPESCRLSGYHSESLAIEAFRDYAGRRTPMDMLQHLVSFAARRVASPVHDTTGQSLHVDDYLGAPGSPARRRVQNALSRLATRLANARARNTITDLKQAFGEYDDD